MLTPIALFVYDRPHHTLRTIESLLKNPEARNTDITIYSDAAKTIADQVRVDTVRAYIDDLNGFRSITVIKQEKNFGLSKSIVEGLNHSLSKFQSVIVLEDDMVVSPYFLRYMNEALKKYENDERVVSVHGYVYPVIDPLPKTFFLRGADCWGWATWRRGWRIFNPNAEFLLREIERRNLETLFNYNNSYCYTKMLRQKINGENDSWAILWYASAFLADKLTLYPGRSLVQNIGDDNSGIHCGNSKIFTTVTATSPIELEDIEVKQSRSAHESFERFFQSIRPNLLRVILSKFKRIGHLLQQLVDRCRTLIPAGVTHIIFRERCASYQGPYGSWDEAASKSGGYSDESILDRVLASALEIKNGKAAFERDSVLFSEIQYSWPVTAALMWSAAINQGKLSVLDFGGSLGTSYFQNRFFHTSLRDVNWSVVEQKQFVECGRNYFQDTNLKFYENLSACLASELPDVILLGSVLQYIQEPGQLIRSLLNTKASLIVIDRSPFSECNEDVLLIQHVPSNIYKASYPMWVLSESKLRANFPSSWQEISCFNSAETDVNLSYIKFSFKGFIFKKADS